MKATQNAKMAAKSSKTEMLIFELCSTSDDRLSNSGDESCLKCKKMATKLSKNEMLIFGLCSTSDDQPSNLSDESCPKCRKKNGPKVWKETNFQEKFFMAPPP